MSIPREALYAEIDQRIERTKEEMAKEVTMP